MLLLLALPALAVEPTVPDVLLASPHHLVVPLGSDASPSDDPAAWGIRSAEDADYAEARNPVAVSVRTRASALVPEGWPYPAVLEHEVVLQLPEPLTRGARYTVSGPEGDLTLEHLPSDHWSPAIKVNQVGLLPDAPGRWAYVSYWPGALEPIALGVDERSFHVVDEASGETVLEGELGLRLAHDVGSEDAYGSNYASANVYEADLSALTAPGTYHLVWEGVGRSWSFAVDEAVYDAPLRTVFRALYHQRCGTALVNTDWAHGACHTEPVVLTEADYHVVGADAFGDLPAQATGETVDATGGYHDAGDYDRRIEHLEVVDVLVDLYELYAPFRTWEDAGLPESGNGLPDVLDEAIWALELYAQLQGEEGGVRAGVETTAYPAYDAMPEEDTTTTWYAYAEDPASSYRFAGAAARLSGALAEHDLEASTAWMERAVRAWEWAEANPRSYDTAPLAAYAAAALAARTGDARFDEAFAQVGPFATDPGWSLEDWDGDEWIPALWIYARGGGDAELRTASERVLVERADAWIRWAEGTGYRLVKHPYAGVALGLATTPRDAGLLLRVHALNQETVYREWAIYACDHALGANAAGLSWVTGVGDRAVRGVLHTPSLADDVEEPLPGLVVYGPAWYESSSGIHGSVIDAFDPPIASWPILERYADVSYSPVINEFTVHESLAPTVFAFGALATLADDATGEDDTGRPPLDNENEARGCGCAAPAGAPAPWLAMAALGLLRRRRWPRRGGA